MSGEKPSPSIGSCASIGSQPEALEQPQKSPAALPSLNGAAQMPFSPFLNAQVAALPQQMQIAKQPQQHHLHGHAHVHHQQQPHQLPTTLPFANAMSQQQLLDFFKLRYLQQHHPCMTLAQLPTLMTSVQLLQVLLQMVAATQPQNQKNGLISQQQQAKMGMGQKMVKGTKKNCQMLTKGTNVLKPGKRRSSMNSQGSISSTGSSSTTLSMQSQQSDSNGTPITPRTPINSGVERLNMDNNNKLSSTATQIGSTIKQKRNNDGRIQQHQKEVTSAGGFVPKKTRRMSMDIDDFLAVPADAASSSSGATPKSSKKNPVDLQHLLDPNAMNCTPSPISIKLVQQQQQQGVSSVSPSASGHGSSSPTGTIASPTEQRTNIACEWAECTVQFNVEEEFVAHVKDVHIPAEQAPKFFCRWRSCKRDEPFNAQYMLVQHVRKHSGEKPFKCQFVDPTNGVCCPKRYSRLENKKTHERSHTGQRPYKCQHCPKKFTNASDKAKHQNRTHKEAKDYACPVYQCPKEYTDPSSLRKHVCHEHGQAVWDFAKAHKGENKAKDYGKISIHKDGTPFVIPSGTSSSDEDRDVD